MCAMTSVDIIIPIYNAYEDLVICLESLYRYTDLTRNRLILINDCSPDERIRPYLDSQVGDGIIVLHNEKNQGFSANINLGMAQSDRRDVILLNSDTILTKNWVEKLVRCAYSDPTIGTVTPLSNNATLCSVPNFCEENWVKEGMTVDDAASIAERVSLRRYPRITVAHGFCMYVKREVIDLIGNFDAATFGRGYGEENDFCNRCEQMGYHHVMCDDTYIYHTGTKSFVSKEKEAYIKAHDEILRSRYPVQMHNNDLHVRDNPNRAVQENFRFYYDLFNGKKNILFLLQSDFRTDAEDHVGGTQLHVRDLTAGLTGSFNVFVAARNGEQLNLTAYLDGEEERFFQFYIGPQKPFFEYETKLFDGLWRSILSAFRIDLIHIHHVITTSMDLFRVAQEYGIPVVYTAHDFYCVCPTVKLLDPDWKLCIGCESPEKCRACLRKTLGISDRIDYLPRWRARWQQVLEAVRAVVVPDESAAEILCGYYPFLKEKLQVIPHGYDPETASKKETGVDSDAGSVTDGPEQPVSTLPELTVSSQIRYYMESVQKEGASWRLEGWAYYTLDSVQEDRIYMRVTNAKGQQLLLSSTRISRADVTGDAAKSEAGYKSFIPASFPEGGRVTVTPVIRHAGQYLAAAESYETEALSGKEKEGLCIAFIGGLNEAKGGIEVCEILKASKDRDNWFVFGGIGVYDLAHLKQDNVMKTGYYAPEDLPALLRDHRIDVIGILSIWPETYSYTLTESWLYGIPAIVTDVGALGRRVKETGLGWTVSLENTKEDFLALIGDLKKHPEKLAAMRRALADYQLPATGQMAGQYAALYDRLWSGTITYEQADSARILAALQQKEGSRIAVEGVGGETGDADLTARLADTRRELNAIKSSAVFKLVSKIWEMKIPARSFLRRLVLRGRG